MPNQFQPFNLSTDVITTKTLLHEALPITGTIYKFQTGSYIEENIKNFSHGQFQSVYDYPYLSSSANHIFDLTVGYDEASPLSSSNSIQNSKKINMYNSMTQVLLGYSKGTGEFVERFEADLNISDNSNQMLEVFFVNFSRLLTKDQIKKGSFSMTLATGSIEDAVTAGAVKTLADSNATSTGGVASALGGDYGILYTSSVGMEDPAGNGVGNIFYQAGIAVITASIFKNSLETSTSGVDLTEEGIFSQQIGDLVQNLKGSARLLQALLSQAHVTHYVIESRTLLSITQQRLTQTYSSAVFLGTNLTIVQTPPMYLVEQLWLKILEAIFQFPMLQQLACIAPPASCLQLPRCLNPFVKTQQMN